MDGAQSCCGGRGYSVSHPFAILKKQVLRLPFDFAQGRSGGWGTERRRKVSYPTLGQKQRRAAQRAPRWGTRKVLDEIEEGSRDLP